MPAGDGRGSLTALGGDCHDFDLHGLVGIRLVDATASDVARVRRQLGPLDARLDREPDITVRFVDRVTSRPLTHIGLHETAFNEDGFFVVGGTAARRGLARLPFEQIGRHPEIVCERTLPAVPHLLAVINLTALAKGVLPLHASAFTTDDTGILVTGWSKGGKTETLLANMSGGARYVGDEWVYLTAGGPHDPAEPPKMLAEPPRISAEPPKMFGIPEPIRLWAWQIDQLPALRQRRARTEKLRLAGWSRASSVLNRIGATGLPGAGAAAKAAPVAGRQSYVQIPPVELFGSAAISLRGRLDAIVLVESHTAADTRVTPISSRAVADRMAASLREERARFETHYRHFQFAFPAERSAAMDAADVAEARLLSRLLADHPAVRVVHPYPCDIEGLGATVRTAAFDAIAARRGADDTPTADVRELRP